MKNWKVVAKAIAAFVGAAATWTLTALADGKVSPVEWAGLAVVLLTMAGVYQVKNALPMPMAVPAESKFSEAEAARIAARMAGLDPDKLPTTENLPTSP